ncbi:MAG TPA: hypothetical protein VFT49_01825 [Candidatus Saccharimonadales bacterium]|nr:hypothetical protein [Candidatus Saccharimonadales bacterium]
MSERSLDYEKVPQYKFEVNNMDGEVHAWGTIPQEHKDALVGHAFPVTSRWVTGEETVAAGVRSANIAEVLAADESETTREAAIWWSGYASAFVGKAEQSAGNDARSQVFIDASCGTLNEALAEYSAS